ncbi:hypothetical protein Desdi_0809 [Desulfitobacterium dichloroeliminans LMG P-21439]|uniref:DUF2178 domain-containing protein n=1 Tax=Desulfitobacterium dichloroeliminans (strain LMG P-21439 / DCA1) TaxID=871963 RepID=L0F3A6_DESDL|nr:hypothetical protein [Desulfitobacterium dichloroeliminans]AGA68334.1 hypothetical protein Desdi_0809 [Desulfitobacterium dichloroeliminans LMG P-21439]
MLKKTSFYVYQLLLGIGLTGTGFLFWADKKNISALLIGVGISLFGTGLFYLYTKYFQQKHPEIKKQLEIETNDERNKMIQNKAKAKSADISQWFILGLAYVMVLLDYPLWLFGITVGIFVLYYVVSVFLALKYQKEM